MAPILLFPLLGARVDKEISDYNQKWSDKEKIPFGMANPLKFDIYVSRRHTVDLLESIME